MFDKFTILLLVFGAFIGAALSALFNRAALRERANQCDRKIEELKDLVSKQGIEISSLKAELSDALNAKILLEKAQAETQKVLDTVNLFLADDRVREALGKIKLNKEE